MREASGSSADGVVLPGHAPSPPPAAHPIEGPGARRLKYLDGWRGMSLLWVLVGHFFPIAGFKSGQLGVELFFVLSGRLMAEILFVEQTSLLRFYKRRFSRIFPALLAFLAITFVVLSRTNMRFGVPFFAAAAAFVYNYAAAMGHRSFAIDHIWSLCIEEHAYMLLGVFALLARRKAVPVLPLIFLLSGLSMLDGVLSGLLLKQDWYSNYWRTDSHVASVLVSCGLYLVVRRFPPSRRLAPIAPICAVLGMACFFEQVDWPVSYTLGTILLAVSVCTLDQAPAWLRQALSNRVLTWTGVLSYSIYLWQQPFYVAAAHPSGLPPLLALAAAIASGAASFYLLEQPARQFLNRVLDGKPSPTAAQGAATAALR